MSLNFAAAKSLSCTPESKVLQFQECVAAANDNAGIAINDQVMRAALRHFAEYGLGAARIARTRAEEAFFAGDRKQYDWWLSLCRALDRRMATQLNNGITANTPPVTA